MIKHFDHVTVVVRDVQAAKQFFGLLGFSEDKSVVIKGPQFSAYMGVGGIEAEHVTLVLANVSPRTEVQLLKYRHPDPVPDPAIRDLTKLGFNHICFAVDDLAAEVARLKAKGVQLRNEIMAFHDRKLVFLAGPEGITVELAEWARSHGSAEPAGVRREGSVEVVVRLWIHLGCVAEFEAYEQKAARIMQRYGGVVQKVVRVSDTSPSSDEPPFEVHVLSFPSLEARRSYRADSELAGLAAERNAAISRTEVLMGAAGPKYGGSAAS